MSCRRASPNGDVFDLRGVRAHLGRNGLGQIVCSSRRQGAVDADLDLRSGPVTQPADPDLAHGHDAHRFDRSGPDPVNQVGVDSVHQASNDGPAGADEEGTDEGRNDQADDRVRPRPADQAGQARCHDCERSESI